MAIECVRAHTLGVMYTENVIYMNCIVSVVSLDLYINNKKNCLLILLSIFFSLVSFILRSFISVYTNILFCVLFSFVLLLNFALLLFIFVQTSIYCSFWCWCCCYSGAFIYYSSSSLFSVTAIVWLCIVDVFVSVYNIVFDNVPFRSYRFWNEKLNIFVDSVLATFSFPIESKCCNCWNVEIKINIMWIHTTNNSNKWSRTRLVAIVSVTFIRAHTETF